MIKFGIVFTVFLLVGVSNASALGVKAVRPIAGYKCMSLNLSEDQMLHEMNGPMIRQQPSSTAASLGQVSALVIAADPIRTENGFTQVLTFDGKPGWVESAKLKPFRNTLNPSARCVPSVMSDGRLGFGS